MNSYSKVYDTQNMDRYRAVIASTQSEQSLPVLWRTGKYTAAINNIMGIQIASRAGLGLGNSQITVAPAHQFNRRTRNESSQMS